MAVLFVKSPKWSSFWISIFLLLILLQMLISLQLYSGVFVLSEEVLISPLIFCPTLQHGEQSCTRWSRFPLSEAVFGMGIVQTMVVLCFYVPVVLVAFSLLAMLFAAYSKDKAALWCSLACQAPSGLLMLAGIILFLLHYWSYLRWNDMTVCFYVCVGVPVQLVVTSVLTYMSGRKLPDWK